MSQRVTDHSHLPLHKSNVNHSPFTHINQPKNTAADHSLTRYINNPTQLALNHPQQMATDPLTQHTHTQTRPAVNTSSDHHHTPFITHPKIQAYPSSCTHPSTTLVPIFQLSTSSRASANLATNRPTGYFDNGASYHLVNLLPLLYDTRTLNSPMHVDGVGGRIQLTHQGRLRALPAVNNMNLAYYSKDLPSNLISLGHLQRTGATYGSDPTRPHTHVIIRLGQSGPKLATVRLSTNNLLPIDFTALEQSTIKSAICNDRGTSRPSAAPAPTYHPTHNRALLGHHHTAEQLRRADEAEELHRDHSHPSDSTLCADLSAGKIPWSTLASADVHLNRTLRGPCAHCHAGKMTAPHAPSSTSAPATSPGGVLSFDLHQLSEPSPGGFTHAIHVVDEHSGKLDIIGTTSKTTLAVSRALRYLIAEYNSDGHRIHRMHGDAEKINASLIHFLGLLGIKLQLSLPGEHTRRIERYERTLSERSAATLSSLPYYLPAKYTLLLHRCIARIMNDSICTQSSPSTPNEVIGRPKPARASLAFGRCCIVAQHEDKRQALAKQHNLPLNQIGKAELGVSMGYDPISKHTLFLLANGLILPRRVRFVLPHSFVPFNWTAKEYYITQVLATANLPSPPGSPNPDSTQPIHQLNPVVQLPNADPSTAIQSLTEHPPDTPPYHTLESTRTSIPTQLTPSPSQNIINPPNDISFEPSAPVDTNPLSAHSPPQVDTAPLVVHSTTPLTTLETPPPAAVPIPTRSSSRSNFGKNTHLQLLHSQEADFRTKPSSALLSAAITRKLAALKQAATRNKLHVATLPTTPQLNNRSTTIEPTPPPRHRAEISIRKAIATLGISKTSAGILREMHKIFTTYKAMKPIAWSDIEAYRCISQITNVNERKAKRHSYRQTCNRWISSNPRHIQRHIRRYIMHH